MVPAGVAEAIALRCDCFAKIEAVREIVNLYGKVRYDASYANDEKRVTIKTTRGEVEDGKLYNNKITHHTTDLVVGNVAADLNLQLRHVVVVATEREDGLAGAVGSLWTFVFEPVLDKGPWQVR